MLVHCFGSRGPHYWLLPLGELLVAPQSIGSFGRMLLVHGYFCRWKHIGIYLCVPHPTCQDSCSTTEFGYHREGCDVQPLSDFRCHTCRTLQANPHLESHPMAGLDVRTWLWPCRQLHLQDGQQFLRCICLSQHGYGYTITRNKRKSWLRSTTQAL